MDFIMMLMTSGAMTTWGGDETRKDAAVALLGWIYATGCCWSAVLLWGEKVHNNQYNEIPR
jgi:hypothetical protein